MFEREEQFMKEMRDLLTASRERSIATFEHEAERAAAAGKRDLSRHCLNRADEYRAHRFHWEVERDAA